MKTNESHANFDAYYAARGASLSLVSGWEKTQSGLDLYLQNRFKVIPERPVTAKFFYKEGESAEKGSTPAGVCAVIDGELVVAYRGTEALNLDDYRADIKFNTKHVRYGDETVSVHSGFHDAYLKSKSSRDAVMRELDPEGKLGIAFAGHSMGGSIASLAALDIQYNGFDDKKRTTSVTTYGAPACLAADAAKLSKDKIDARRIEIEGDPIPHAYKGFYQHNTSNVIKIPPTEKSTTGFGHHAMYDVYTSKIDRNMVQQGNIKAEERRLARETAAQKRTEVSPYSITGYLASIRNASMSLFRTKSTLKSMKDTLQQHAETTSIPKHTPDLSKQNLRQL